MTPHIYILLTVAAICSVVMDKVQSGDVFARFGNWFSKDGYKNKYRLAEWLNKFLPLWLAKFIAMDVLVIFCDLFHTAKFIMILSFCLCISFSMFGVAIWLCWSLVFNVFYAIIR